MALNKEIWVGTILEGFIPNNSFAAQSVDHSEYVNGKTVHVPNAGTGAAIQKNRTSLPATIGTRTDQDLSYDLAIFTSDPLRTEKLAEVELSYDKRTSILAQTKENLQKAVMEEIMYNWVPSSPSSVATSGAGAAAHIPTATGSRKALTKADVLAVKTLMDKDDVPADGRYMLLDAVMYNQLLNDLTNAETMNFLAGANPETGVVGQYMGFQFYMRSKVLKTVAAGTLKAWTSSAAATDSAAGLAWQKGCVSRALGSVEVFEDTDNPQYYGDIISMGMRAGGKHIRTDKNGVVLIYQATVS